MPTNELTRQQLLLVKALAQAKVQLDRATTRMEELKAQARDELPLGYNPLPGWHGSIAVVLTPNRIWNKEKGKENYGDEICTMQVDLKKAREVMTADEFDALYVNGQTKVEVKIS